ncbi:hypothetical protein [Sulfurivermis fontis]|jgi:hypothetical protein|uniref:hypothetical protein n=1 Tax=Sulfurivermis fontis TaxID=1972068 RepID=UPI000FD71F50|nr:hypothetical protein [Sulfurivermis fontis]
MPSRRRFLFSLAILAALPAAAHAAPPSVEIIAMAHPPVRAALAPVRSWLAAQGSKVSVHEIDMETPAGHQRLAAMGLRGHIPILILIDGQYRFQRADGGTVALVNFPDSPASPPGVRGNWQPADVEAAVQERMQP